LISLYFYTLINLKFKQIYYRFLFYLSKPIINNNSFYNLRVPKNNFYLPIKKKVSLIDQNTFLFLNKSYDLSKIGWNNSNSNISKLWRYNQHYFDDLNSRGAISRKVWHKKLINLWINQNPVGIGVGWEPYPTSLRIVNWIKWHFLGNTLPDIVLQSLIIQSQWLNQRIEWHLLGNHLFANAKALVFAGLFFSGKEAKIFLKKGLNIIDQELSEQILDDGGNFERSPMYHAIFLEDLLDLINIAKIYPKIIPKNQLRKWIKISKNMFRWLEIMTHPDREISFFNDSAFGVAPSLDKLKKYGRRLGLNFNSLKLAKVTHLVDSGYIRINSKDALALLDVAPIGPDYIPAHAHADTLSFELSLFNQRFIVNSGTSEYEDSTIRHYERSTKAHNTIEINNENSSEVWSIFRVAKRAYPFNLSLKKLEKSVSISCSHNGYERFCGKPIHRRNWEFFETSLIIKDYIEGSFRNAYAYFHFHPLVNLSKDKDNIWNIKFANDKKIKIEVKEGKAKLKKNYYSPEFGKKIQSNHLKISLGVNGSCVKILWINSNE
jgi:uncharacterized heparinase superfamily protein